MTRIVLPFNRGTIGTPGAQYGERTYRNAFGQWITHFHCGVDFQVVAGSTVRAVAAGRVVEVSHSPVRGYMIAIDHGDGTGHRFHMIASRGRPRVGTHVRQGQVIGYVADDDEQGSSSNGDHAHFEYRISRITGETAPRVNTPNPLAYLAAIAGNGATNRLEDDMPTAHEIAEAVWNYNIGGEGKGGKDNTPAWIRLSWAHADGAELRKQLLGPIDSRALGAPDTQTGTLAQRIAWIDYRLRQSEAREIGLQAAITALASAQGLDAAVITDKVEAAVNKALADIEITLRPTPATAAERSRS